MPSPCMLPRLHLQSLPISLCRCAVPQFVEDPYTKARFQPECSGQISPVGDISRIGLDASGLINSTTQLR